MLLSGIPQGSNFSCFRISSHQTHPNEPLPICNGIGYSLTFEVKLTNTHLRMYNDSFELTNSIEIFAQTNWKGVTKWSIRL